MERTPPSKAHTHRTDELTARYYSAEEISRGKFRASRSPPFAPWTDAAERCLTSPALSSILPLASGFVDLTH